ncbi:MAG TPA: hypothetical protein VE964_18220, partial [Myxococcales bacterium]|nr:hypothetical protein [Myxococcales bacterium]
MLATLLLSLAAAAPAQRFAEAFPSSSRIASVDGRVLVHASGFAAPAPGAAPEAAARGFLARHGSAFGIGPAQELVLRQAPAAGRAGAVRFERRLDGLPLFGADVVVGMDAQSRVFVVNARDVPATPSGRHALGEAAAVGSALSSLPLEVRGAQPVAVAAGWRGVLGSLRPVYRVDLVADLGSWRTFVDAESGRPLLRESLRYSVNGTVYAVSPAETVDSLCPLSGSGHSLCAVTSVVPFPNLTTGTDLTGTQTTVSNCKGNNFPTNLTNTGCSSVNAVSGAFNFDPDTTFFSTIDDFAAAMA